MFIPMISSFSSPTLTLTDDVIAHGELTISFFGYRRALGFKGNNAFIHRCFNLCVNRGIVSTLSHLRWPYGPGEEFAYVVVETKERILRGLAEQFRSEIIMHEEIPPLNEKFDEETGEYTVEFDEPMIHALASARAADFAREHIRQDDFVTRLRVNTTTLLAAAS